MGMLLDPLVELVRRHDNGVIQLRVASGFRLVDVDTEILEPHGKSLIARRQLTSKTGVSGHGYDT